MRRAIAVLVASLAAVAFLLLAAPAHGADNPVTIVDASTVEPDPVKITVDDTITWTNGDSLPHDIYLEGGRKLTSTPILPGNKFTTRIGTTGTLRYGLRPSDFPHTIESRPKPTTTTAPAPTTTTSTAPTTTTASSTTTTTTTTTTASTSTASSSTTSSTTLAAAPLPPRRGGSSAAPLLAAAAAVVAALAGVTFWAWRRSGQIAYGAGSGTDGLPPTAGQPPV